MHCMNDFTCCGYFVTFKRLSIGVGDLALARSLDPVRHLLATFRHIQVLYAMLWSFFVSHDCVFATINVIRLLLPRNGLETVAPGTGTKEAIITCSTL